MLYLLGLIVLLSGCSSELSVEEAKQRQLSSINKSIAHYPDTSIQTASTRAGFSNVQLKQSRPRDSQYLAHLVQSQLMQAPELTQSRVQTVSYFGDILVVGTIPDQASTDTIHHILKANSKVKHFYTYLRTNSTAPQQYARDSMIKTSIIKKFADLDTPTTHLQIIVDNGEVYLLGKLSKSEQREVTQAVLALKGVSKVHFSGKNA